MIKQILKSAVLLAISGMLFSCSHLYNATEKSDDKPGDKVTMTATVTALGDRLEVEVTESEYTFGVHWVITDSAVFYDKSGNEISKSGIKVGDSVKIYYSGQVMLSYPPQIVAAKIILQ